MKLKKVFWGVRALLYKTYFKKAGNMCYIGKPLIISGAKGISIGNRVRVFPGLRIECIGDAQIEIGNNVVIEQNVHIISGGGVLHIGDDVTIAPNTFITNTNHEYRDIKHSVMDQGLLVNQTDIEDGCFLGYGVAVQAGTHLGKHCIVGSNTVLQGSYPDYCVIVGNPGKVIKRYNTMTNIWENTKQ